MRIDVRTIYTYIGTKTHLINNSVKGPSNFITLLTIEAI